MNKFESKFTTEHFAALGKINVYFQFLENQIDTLLAAFVGSHVLSSNGYRVTALFSEVAFKSKCSTLRSLINDIDKFEDISDMFPEKLHDKGVRILEEIKELLPLFKEIDKCSSIRNKYAHSHWIDGGICGPEKSVARYKIRAKGKGVKKEFEFETADTLENHASFIFETYEKTMKVAMLLHSLTLPENET